MFFLYLFFSNKGNLVIADIHSSSVSIWITCSFTSSQSEMCSHSPFFSHREHPDRRRPVAPPAVARGPPPPWRHGRRSLASTSGVGWRAVTGSAAFPQENRGDVDYIEALFRLQWDYACASFQELSIKSAVVLNLLNVIDSIRVYIKD